MPVRPMVWCLSCMPVGMKQVIRGRFITSVSDSASRVAGSSTQCRSGADLCRIVSSKWSMVDERRRLAWMQKAAEL